MSTEPRGLVLSSSDVGFARESILTTAVERILSRSSESPMAIIVSGSFGRGEETILPHDEQAHVLGDAELYVVFADKEQAKAFRKRAKDVESEIQSDLAQQGILCPVSIAAPSRITLERTPPNLLSYELRTTGAILWGDRTVLELIPGFTPRQIPKWDAWRSVANRMIEQLAYVDALDGNDPERLKELLYRSIKLQLELATMVLHFLGVFEPTYIQRLSCLKTLNSPANRRELPSWLDALTLRVERCTHFKIAPGLPSVYRDVFLDAIPPEAQSAFLQEECRQVLDLARSIWHWGAGRLLGNELHRTLDPLRVGLEVARKQDWSWRLRGWARLGVVESGWKDLGYWSRVFRLSSRGGPRFLTYSVAATLYFAWGAWLGSDRTSANAVAQRAMGYFPFGGAPVSGTNWLDACQTVVNAWNRHLKTSWA